MKKTLLFFLSLFTISILFSQNPEEKLPGNPLLPSSEKDLMELAAFETKTYKYSVEDYFQTPKQHDFQLSPNGLYLSYMERDDEGKNHVYIKNTITNEVVRVIEEKGDVIDEYRWANDNRLIYLMYKNANENFHLFAVDLDGKNQKELNPFDGITSMILNELIDQKDYVIIDMNRDNPEIFEPYRINIQSGEIEKLFENKDVDNPIMEYHFDKDGNLKGYTQQRNGTDYLFYYRTDHDKDFELIIKTKWDEVFDLLGFDYNTDNPHDAFVSSNIKSNTREIFLYDFKKKKVIKDLYSNDIFDISGIGQSRKRGYEIDYYRYSGEKATIVPVSETYKKMHKSLLNQFPNSNIIIVSSTDEEDKFLIDIDSDKLYGGYYLYDTNNGEFKELFNLMPSLDPNDMAEMRPIKFTSRDGLNIYGYLTIPNKELYNGKVPLIVNPHAGPYNFRNNWQVIPEVQLFASRGYATLHINFRGSGGYGKEFLLAGSKQIGRKMLNDLEDGVEYVKTLGIIDEDKMVIYGSSYGGLAALGSLVKTPDLYTCAIDYAGVSNLFTFFESFPPYWKPYMGQIYEQWYDANSPEEQKIIRQVSPALNVDKIKKPVFVIQGVNDPRVSIEESDQIVEGLRKRGIDAPYMVRYNEGHGFQREKNRIQLYQIMMGFLAKHLK